MPYKFLQSGTENVECTTLHKSCAGSGLCIDDVTTEFDVLQASVLETNDANWNLIAKLSIMKFDKEILLNTAFSKCNFLASELSAKILQTSDKRLFPMSCY